MFSKSSVVQIFIILQNKKPGILKEMANSKAGEDIIQMNFEHLVGPESTEVFKKQNNVGVPKRTGSQTGRVPNGQR